MRLLPLAILGAALLSGCRETPPPPPPRVLSADELRPLYREFPRTTLPALGSSPLGQTYTLGGVVKDWQASRDVALYQFPQNGQAVTVGTLTSTGTLQMTAPLNLTQTNALKLRELIGVEGALCPVTELNFSSNPEVRVMGTTLLVRIADLSARVKATALQPQTSPVPYWAYIGPDVSRTSAGTPSKTALLIYSPEEVTISGERRCIRGFEQTQPPGWKSIEQRHVRASVKLGAGWNAVLNTNQVLDAQSGVTDSLWTALPTEELAVWRLN